MTNWPIGGGGASAQHRTAITNWPNIGIMSLGIKCFGSDDIMSLGIESFAAEGIHDGFLDSRWVPGFTIDKWMLNPQEAVRLDAKKHYGI